jgi:uncharacterized membrane protein AbrB (regulator of aidB expression)
MQISRNWLLLPLVVVLLLLAAYGVSAISSRLLTLPPATTVTTVAPDNVQVVPNAIDIPNIDAMFLTGG